MSTSRLIQSLFKVLLISTLIISPLLLLSQPKGKLLVRKTQDFELDGAGSHEAWNRTSWAEITAQRNPRQNTRTQAKVLYSDSGLYFLFDCQDSLLTASMTEDMAHLWEEDVVEVFLWTDKKHPIYFEYEISPLNYELPILVPNLGSRFRGWAPWDYEGDRMTRRQTSVQGGSKRTGASISSWRAEFFIPYELLIPLTKVPPTSGTKWRANMYRIDYDDPANPTWFTWQEIRTNFHDYKRFGTFIFE